MWTDELDLLIDRDLVVVRWRRSTVAAARALHTELERHHAQLGLPLFLAVIVGPDCPPPDLSTRDALLRGYDGTYHRCRAVHMVVIGNTARQVIMRSVVTAMTLAASLRGQTVVVDKSVHELVLAAARTLGRDVDATVGQMIAAGVLTLGESTG